jgi:biopolymer transport protein TolR
MNRKLRKQRLVSEINITPFTDVILVLLIIFMITTPLIQQSSLKVNLPQAASATPMNDRGQVTVTITAEGPVYLEKDLVTRKELKDKISVMFQKNPDLSVVMQADRLVSFKDIVSVLDIFTGIGVKKLDIVATTGQWDKK